MESPPSVEDKNLRLVWGLLLQRTKLTAEDARHGAYSGAFHIRRERASEKKMATLRLRYEIDVVKE